MLPVWGLDSVYSLECFRALLLSSPVTTHLPRKLVIPSPLLNPPLVHTLCDSSKALEECIHAK